MFGALSCEDSVKKDLIFKQIDKHCWEEFYH